MKHHAAPLVAAGLLVMAAAAQAGRPLSTDDAATADAGRCLVEAWVERAGDSRAYVLAPACGVAEGLELDGQLDAVHPRTDSLADVGLALKWVPAAASIETPLGALALGAKFGFGSTQPVSGGWRLTGFGGVALASLTPHPDVALHLNLGPQYDRDNHAISTVLNGALTWTPCPSAVLIAEWLASDRDRPARIVGARWWLQKDKFGLDLTAARQNGTPGATLWTFGFGWYQ